MNILTLRIPDAMVLLFATLLPACGQVEVTDPLPPIQVERVVLSFATQHGLRSVLGERSDAPVQATLVAPLGKTGLDAGALPALLMPPPARVAFDVPPGPPGSVLSFATGFQRSGYKVAGRARVLFEVELDGKVIFETRQHVGRRTPRLERCWRRWQLPLEQGGRVVLRTSVGDGVDAASILPAAFGIPQWIQPMEIPRTRPRADQPNVIVIVIDTLRADGLHTYGNPLETSPVLDALAKRGELFERVLTPSSWTWPSTASLFTTLAPAEHGFIGPDSCHLDDDLETLAEAFQRAGFTTTGFSCNPLVAANKNLAQGFEAFHEYDWASTRDVEEDIVAWMDEPNLGRFFLYLHLIDPHTPNDPDADAVLRLVPENKREPVLDRAGLAHFLGQQAMEVRKRTTEKLEAQRDHERAMYDAEVLTVDAAIGRLLDQLASRDMLDNTIIAVTSDHGQEFLEHGQFGHGRQLHEESLHVPLLIAGPGLQEGLRHPHQTEGRFFARTLLDLAGVEIPPGNLMGPERLHSTSSAPIFLSTQTGAWFDQETGKTLGGTVQGVLYDGFLLHRCEEDQDGGPGWLHLYDLGSDPRAQTDVSPERPEEVTRLRDLLDSHLRAADLVRPAALGGGQAVRDELRSNGYLGSDE